MDPVAAPYLAAAGLLMIAGVAKLARPAGVARLVGAWRLVGRPSTARLLARALGAAEVLAGAAALVVGGAAAAVAVALLYAGFAIFLLVTRPADCGCFGSPQPDDDRGQGAPVLHAVLDLAVAALAAAAAIAGAPALADAVDQSPAGGLPLLTLTAMLAWLGHAAMTALPALLGEVRAR